MRDGKILEGMWTIKNALKCPIFSMCKSDCLSRANQQRSQKIFKAQQPIDLMQVRTKLQGFGMQLLDGIDPNPDNFVCAGIVHMRAQQVGCLLRLEPNKQAQVNFAQRVRYFALSDC